MLNVDEQKINELLDRGVEEVIDRENLKKKLLSGKKLRVKLGIDPTSPNLHLGRSVPILKLQDFQKLGHTPVFIVGDFTGVIGDTSDKDSERPMLSHETIKNNMKSYKEQLGKLIDIKNCEFHYNSKWLKKLGFEEIGYQANTFSVNQFISRDNIARRLRAGKRVSLREVLYPLMQGYDSVAVEADVELGSTDQKFNLLAGRDLQKEYKQNPQEILMTSIIEGTDGRKMSSSWGNTINFLDSSNEMYGKIMSIRDNLILRYFEMLTRTSFEAIREYEKKLKSGENPKKVKMALASEIVRMYHGDKEALEAEENFEKTFAKGDVPDDIKTVKVKIKIPIVDILIKEGIVASKTEFRRLIEEGAIKFKGKLEEKKIVDPKSLTDESGSLKIGKKRFLKIEVIKSK
ncbi:MAG: tyrosine--tRNA ligase [Bacteroidetes bacterium]|nr:tyrosine--tRNA ligase [Bacteroidota bacterium]